MSFTLHSMAMDTFVPMLGTLSNLLDKGAEHMKAKGQKPDVLTEARLAPDMYTLSRQVQAACDGVKFLAARTANKEPPKHPDSDNYSLDELRARIRSVVEYASGFTPKDFEGADQRIVPLSFIPGKGLAAADFVREMNVPNTTFHLCMAYAILRHNGVPLGKQDYIPKLSLRDI